MCRYLVAQRLSKTGPWVSHGPYRSAKKTLKALKGLGVSSSLVRIRDQESNEWLKVKDLKAQAAADKAVRGLTDQIALDEA